MPLRRLPPLSRSLLPPCGHGQPQHPAPYTHTLSCPLDCVLLQALMQIATSFKPDYGVVDIKIAFSTLACCFSAFALVYGFFSKKACVCDGA